MGLSSLGLSACGGSDAAPVTISSVEFIGMSAPGTDALRAASYTSASVKITYSDATTKSQALGYNTLFKTGDTLKNGSASVIAGGYYDINGNPIIDTSGATAQQFFSDCPDGNSLISLANPTVAGVTGNTLFLVTQYEYATANNAASGTRPTPTASQMYGTLPSPITVTTLDQDKTTGALKVVKHFNVDTKPANGLWITCASSLSPWNTHLSSEEYEPDAPFVTENKQFKAFSKNLFGDEKVANPYHYGHLPEVTVHPDGSGTIVKHYCMGRISHELIQVMPDNRTALMGDDYTNSGLFVFVADKEKDLSAGTLYVAKLGSGFSINPIDAGTKLSWIKLGHATSKEIEKLANTLKPADIMTVLKADPNDASFTKVFYNGTANWVKVKPGMEKAAAFLETHRYAYLMGGSMGFSKMEGTTVNIKDKVAYSALQNIQDSMVKTGKGWNAASGIALDKALVAGGVMALPMAGGQVDQTGAAIKSEWLPVAMRALLMGEDISPDALGNLANPDKVSNPDNLKFSEKLRTLFIGEDSGTHVNNFVWAYNVDTKKLSRLMSMPSGAEATGLGVVDDLNGWMYITSNFQHPGDWNAKLHGKVQATLDPLVRANYKDRFGAAVGYLTAQTSGIKLG